MSTKKTKYLGLILCCMILCACVVGFVNVAPKTYADDDVTAITLNDLTTFTTTDGVQIRTEIPTGIRFATSISQGEYDGLVKQYGLENLEFGMAIARVGSLEELKAADITKTLKPMSYWMAGFYPGSGSQTYQYSFAIVEINESNFNRQYTTIGYVKVGDEIAYAKDASGQEFASTRTPLQAATTLLAEHSEEDQTFAREIIDAVMATDVTFELQDASRPWGEEIELVATVDGKAVTPIYSVADPTVATAEGGKLIGLKQGSTEVTATLNGVNTSYTATATVTFTEKVIAPALNAEGMLELYTEGQQTTISVYAADDTEFANVLTTTTTDQATFDIRDLIITYMENNSITTFADYAYKAIIKSDDYQGVYVTEEFVPIKNETIGAGYGTRFGYTVANTHSGSKAVGHYFYLVEDIDISTSAAINTTGYNQTNVVLFSEISIDGRGHSIVNTYTHTSTTSGYTGLFGYLKKTDEKVGPRIKWSNIHIQMNVTLKENCAFFGLFACEAQNVLFENCYFEANVLNNCAKVANLGGIGWGSELRNCIVELNNSSNSTKGLCLNRDTAIGSQIIKDTAIIDSINDAVISGVTTSLFAENAYGYRSIADFIAGTNGRVMYSHGNGFATDDFADKCYEQWSNWEVTETDIILCGKTVRTTLQTEVTPVLDTNGMLALNTKGEETTIKVYDSEQTEIISTITNDTTYDIRENILSWMEDNVTTTGDYVYTVEIESRNYVGTYTSETFIPITSAKEFASKLGSATNDRVGAVKSGIFFLTTDIDISQFAIQNSANGDSVYSFMESNLDGRGHTITNTYTHTKTSAYRGIACYWGFYDTAVRNWWKNVSYKATITTNDSTYRVVNVLGGNVEYYDFYNCYFEATVINNYTTDIGMFMPRFTNCYNCMFVLNNTSADTNDLVLLANNDGGVAGSTLNNCIIINNDDATDVVTRRSGTNDIVVHTAYRYNTVEDFIAGNNGTLRNDDNTAQNGSVANGTKVYTNWPNAWNVTESGISLLGKTVKTITTAN